MRKTFVAITAFAVVPLGAAGCVSKSEYTKTVQAAEARYSALDAENTRLKSELANAGKRNEHARNTCRLDATLVETLNDDPPCIEFVVPLDFFLPQLTGA